jgi:gliding motility-associated-like protein
MCFSQFLYAQVPPTNDDCAGIADLGTAPSCPGTVFTNVGATGSIVGDDNPTCFNGGISERDVWFKFVCPDTLFDFRITLTGTGMNPIENPQFAVYRGDCAFGELAELLCAKADLGETELILDVEGLTPGFTYFIRVSDYSATASPNAGEFTICVDEIPPVSNVDDGSSSLCNGTLYDTGGPDGDYGANEDHTFVICPTAQSACIQFTLEYYNIEEDQFVGGDILSFYDGNSTSAPLIAQVLGGADNFAGNGINSGGVCFSVQATSGCLTVQFESDEDVEFEGWKGTWSCSTTPCEPIENITIDDQVSEQDIIDAVKSPSTTVSIASVNCGDGAYGTFSYPTDNNELGLQKGLMLTSGSVAVAQGPNNQGGAGLVLEPFFTDDLGDADLTYLSVSQGGEPSFDACVVEMDVFVGSNELAFEYVFGSEEYPEYVNSDFNDIFAFLVSGPGIVGDPNIGNQENIAVLPGTNTPVQVNSVNQVVNWQYFRYNSYGQSLQYDGFTSDSLGVKKSLTARVPVIPCNTYRLKFAVADRGDESFDSGVFISDIKAGAPDITTQFTGGVEYLIEQCSNNDNLLLIKLSKAPTVLTNFIVTLGGTAINGVDYTTSLPAVLTFQPGQTQLLYNIGVIADGVPEGVETIKITLSNNFGCGSVVLKEVLVELRDNPEITVQGSDTLNVCKGNSIQLFVEGASTYVWSPSGFLNNPFLSNPTWIQPTQSQLFKVTGSIGVCTGKDSVYVRVIGPDVAIKDGIDTTICLGNAIQLEALSTTGADAWVWTPDTGLSNANAPVTTASPTQTTTYTVTATLENCPVTADITIAVDTLFAPVLVPNATICENYPIVLASNTNGSSSTYAWSPDGSLNDATLSNPIALPDVTTTYTLVTTSANGYCSTTASTTVQVTAANIDISGDDLYRICLGDTVSLTAVTTPAGPAPTWSPAFYVSNSTGSSTQAAPDESVTIYANYTVNGCFVRDSVTIRVDSLPEQAVTKVEDKAVYCEGDTIYLISKTYEPADFPDIKTLWLPGPGQITPDSNWNLVLIAEDTFTYRRVVDNNACTDTTDVLIPVAKRPVFTLTADPNPVCLGTPSQIFLQVDPPNTQYEWMSDPTLSCTDCPNPIATPSSTTSYTVMSQGSPCPAGGGIEIVVEAPPALGIIQNAVICLGDSILLNGIFDPLATYTWSSIPPGFNSTDPTPRVSPGLGSTTYQVIVEGDKCTSIRNVVITTQTASIDAGADQDFCLGETLTLTASTSGASGVITWSPINQQGASVSVTPTQTTAYLASLVFGNGPNCTVSDLVTATLRPSVTLSEINVIPEAKDSICSGERLRLLVLAQPVDVEATYIWTENGVVLPGQTRDSLVVNASISEGTITYQVTATTSAGCSTTSDPITFQVKRCVLIPNAFTPDGDGTNESFALIIPSGTATVRDLQVYNRWGQRVFVATESLKAWDGKVDGKDAPSDVYVWHAVVRYPDGKEEKFKGDVTLVR